VHGDGMSDSDSREQRRCPCLSASTVTVWSTTSSTRGGWWTWRRRSRSSHTPAGVITTPCQPREVRPSTAHTRQPADHLDPAAGLAEGPPTRLVWRILGPVLLRNRRKGGELGQGLQQAGDRGGVAAVVAVGEGVRPLASVGHRGLARVGVAVVEDGPEGRLDLGLGMLGHPRGQVATTVDQAALSQTVGEDQLDRANQPRRPSVPISSGGRRRIWKWLPSQNRYSSSIPLRSPSFQALNSSLIAWQMRATVDLDSAASGPAPRPARPPRPARSSHPRTPPAPATPAHWCVTPCPAGARQRLGGAARLGPL
jgi:hypothetical protein